MFYEICRSLVRGLIFVMYRLKTEGLEHIPSSGPVILCSNHLSNLDPVFLAAPLNRRVHYMAKMELFSIPVLSWLIVKLGAFPVNRGGVSKNSIRTALQLLSEGKVLGIFPEGTRGKMSGVGKKGAASLALKSGAAVIPVAIIGNYRPFRRMKILYGPPLDMSGFADGSSESLEKATDLIMSTIRHLCEYQTLTKR